MAVFPGESFRLQFPEFVAFTDSQLSVYWTMATQYLNPNDGVLLSGEVLQLAVNLMMAHLAKSFLMINAGQQTVVVSGSTEGSVTVSLQAPPIKSGWQWWLSTTPYGAQLWALLQVRSAGGFYIGGHSERSAFRKAGGVF